MTEGATQRTDAKGDGRRDEIALAALPLFLTNGYAGTSMSAVAKAGGVTKATLYHHFASKEALFLAALAADIAEPLAQVRDLAASGAGPPQDRFRKALGLCYDTMVGSSMGALATVISETSRRVPEVARGFHAGFIRVLDDALQEIYDSCVADGTHRRTPPGFLPMQVFGPLLEHAMAEAMFSGSPEIMASHRVGRSRAEFVDAIDWLFRQDGGHWPDAT